MRLQTGARGFGRHPAVASLAAKGRRGDTAIAHVTPGEMVVPPSVQAQPGVGRALARGFAARGMSPERYRVGPDAGVNPATGAPEFAPVDDYLAANPDVAKALKEDPWWAGKTAEDHYKMYGFDEGRAWPAAAPKPPPPPPAPAPEPYSPGVTSPGVPSLPEAVKPSPGPLPLAPANLPAPPTPPRPTEFKAPAAPNVNFDESAESRLTSMLDSGSPYLERARARAVGFAGRRGLQNSSLAATAGEAAAIDAAAPIALNDSQIAATRNLSDQSFRQAQALAGQQFDYDEYMRAIDTTARAFLSDLQYRQAQGLAQQGLDFDAYLQAVKAAAESNLSDQAFRQNAALQSADLASREKLTGLELGSREKIAGQEGTLRRFLGSLDATTRTSLAGVEDARLREIANLQLSGQDRNAAMTTVLNIERTFAEQFAVIANNPNIPADVRDRYLRDFGLQRDAQMRLIEQIYNVDLTWPVTQAA
ncbi:MAG: hypothetical protein FJX68_18705 [Alphaproteobacteria bacterium]|nr:hypothetical protein [Alphaproteobacteria bacterium]